MQNDLIALWKAYEAAKTAWEDACMAASPWKVGDLVARDAYPRMPFSGHGQRKFVEGTMFRITEIGPSKFWSGHYSGDVLAIAIPIRPDGREMQIAVTIYHNLSGE